MRSFSAREFRFRAERFAFPDEVLPYLPSQVELRVEERHEAGGGVRAKGIIGGVILPAAPLERPFNGGKALPVPFADGGSDGGRSAAARSPDVFGDRTPCTRRSEVQEGGREEAP